MILWREHLQTRRIRRKKKRKSGNSINAISVQKANRDRSRAFLFLAFITSVASPRATRRVAFDRETNVPKRIIKTIGLKYANGDAVACHGEERATENDILVLINFCGSRRRRRGATRRGSMAKNTVRAVRDANRDACSTG